MLLRNFTWWSCRSRNATESGMDRLETCADPDYFRAFAKPVVYTHNRRGFRDQEWPDTTAQLSQAVWCFGDSFTVGIGSPRSHTWTYLLEQALERRCINVSQDGQSNEWIAKKIQELTTEIVPQTIIVHWSYTHRRIDPDFDLSRTVNFYWKQFYNQIKDSTWPADLEFENFYTLPESVQKEIKQQHYDPEQDRFDFDCVRPGMYEEDQIVHYVKTTTVEQDTLNTIACIDQVQQMAAQHNINLIHSFVPGFAPDDQIPTIESYLSRQGAQFVPAFDRLDLARDGHHYDIRTAKYFVQQLIELI